MAERQRKSDEKTSEWTNLPLMWHLHGNKVLVAFIIACLTFAAYNYYSKSKTQSHLIAQAGLENARQAIQTLQFVDSQSFNDSVRASDRRRIFGDATANIDQAMADSDTALQAQALSLRGDLNWAMANLPRLAGTTTQPALALPLTPDAYLDEAAGAYKQVVKIYPDQNFAKAISLLGLAAIDENRGSWDHALDDYNQLLNDTAIATAFKDIARQRVALIPDLRLPVFLGSWPATQPSTQATTQSTTEPTSQPAIATSIPTTQP